MLFTLSRIRLGVGHEKMRIFLVIFLRSALPVLFPQTHAVTENGVWLLAGQKPLKRPGWWKGKFTLFWILATQRGSGGWADICPKANSTHTHTHTPSHRQSVGWSFYRPREGATCRKSTVNSDSHLEIGHRWSDQRHLDCFKYT